MKATTTMLGVLAVICLTACSSTKKAAQTPPPIVPIESSTDTKIIHTEKIDTVFITPPAQSAERTTPEKESHLETDYAESDARINEDGTLHHTLKNKNQPKPVPVKNSNDTIYVDNSIEKPVPVPVPVEVERELTWWQKTRLKTWGWLMALLALALAVLRNKK